MHTNYLLIIRMLWEVELMAKVKKVVALQPTEENMVQFEQRAARVTVRILGEILPPQIIDELIRVLKEEQD